MANPTSSDDPRMLKKELKRLEREAKLRKKQLKRERKMQKLERKKAKKEALLRAKLAAKGVKVPPKTETKPSEGPAKAMELAESKLPEAEIISDADVWTPKSAKKMDEIQKLIDRMDHKSVKSLRERYKTRYGEDLEVPDAYEVKPSIEVETAEETGELAPLITTSATTTAPEPSTESTTTGGGFFSRKLKADKPVKEKTQKVPRTLRFLDYRTPLYLREKYGAMGGGGKRVVLIIIDIILNIFLFPIKIFTTIIYIIKDRREQKLLTAMENESAQPQPTS